MDAGLFEPLASIGDAVEAGQPAALIHFPDTPWRAPVELPFPRSGIVVCVRPLAACARGDSLFQTGDPWPDAFA
jgi:predicted deacylase